MKFILLVTAIALFAALPYLGTASLEEPRLDVKPGSLQHTLLPYGIQ